MANIHDVATKIVAQFNDGISTMKLQKLTFLAHGWSLALRQIPLTEEPFVLWKSGPVSKTLYEVHKNQYTVYTWNGNINDLSKEEAVIIDAVVRQYGALSGPQLKEVVNKNATWADLNGTSSQLFVDEIAQHFTRTLIKA